MRSRLGGASHLEREKFPCSTLPPTSTCSWSVGHGPAVRGRRILKGNGIARVGARDASERTGEPAKKFLKRKPFEFEWSAHRDLSEGVHICFVYADGVKHEFLF